MADAYDLENAVAHGAAAQKALGSTESLDADALSRSATSPGPRPRSTCSHQGDDRRATGRTDGLPAAREVVLHAHFDATAGEDGADGLRTHRTSRGAPAPPAARPAPVLVRRLPHQDHHQAGHRPQHRPLDTGLQGPRPDPRASRSPRPHVRLPVVHPTRPGLRCRPHHRVRPRRRRRRPTQPDPTATWNLGALCRFHHRLKTHSAWRYEMTEPGVFEWTSPHGHHYRRDQQRHHRPDPPDPGPPRIPRQRRP